MTLANEINNSITEEEYVNGELFSDIKHEYIEGHIYAMSGASTNHNRIMTNFVSELRLALKNTPCEPFSSDMKVQVGNDFFYPDALVVCDHIANDNGITDAPLIIVEVLSKSTRQIDHTLKRNAYQSLESLQEYVVIEQDIVDIEVCRRKKHWQSEHYYLGDEIYFESIDCHLSVLEIYDRVVNADIENYFNELEKQENISES
jgi:Uma2 family endonuclease